MAQGFLFGRTDSQIPWLLRRGRSTKCAARSEDMGLRRNFLLQMVLNGVPRSRRVAVLYSKYRRGGPGGAGRRSRWGAARRGLIEQSRVEWLVRSPSIFLSECGSLGAGSVLCDTRMQRTGERAHADGAAARLLSPF